MRDCYVCPLTGLLSRRLGLWQIERMCRRAAASGEPVGLLFLDIDGMRDFNDRHSHEVGDRLIFRWARVLEGCVEEGAVIASWSGQQFVIAVPAAQTGALKALAETIRARIASATVSFRGQTYGPLTATILVSCVPDDGTDASELLNSAREFCWMGRPSGSNRVAFASDEFGESLAPH